MAANSEEDMYEDDEERLQTTSIYFVVFSAMLAFVMVSSKYLHESPSINSFVSEAALILLTGIFVGSLVHVILPNFEPETAATQNEDNEENVLAHSLLSFSPNIFFMALLPPILFNSGYQIRRELFYRHIKPILMFACWGTTICAITTGFLLYGISSAGWMGSFTPTLLEFLTFGALIAATDTVSILTVFQAKKVDPHLFYLVIGESALNDAIALVLFSAFGDLLRTAHLDGARTIAMKILEFFLAVAAEAVGSPLLGVVFSMGTALMFKHIDLRLYPALELPLYMLLMYTPFVVAECFHLSGIVTIFFSGISARRYVAPNVSEETERNAEVIFKLASYMAETSIFLELGLSVFGLPGSFNWAFIAWAFAASMLGRAIGIYPLSIIYNWSLKEWTTMETTPAAAAHIKGMDPDELMKTATNAEPLSTASSSPGSQSRRMTPEKRKDRRISWAMIHVLWFAGLRGAVAYACVRKFPNLNGHADEFTAAVMVIVLVSIIVMGGATESLLRFLRIDMGVDEDEYMAEWTRKRQLRGCWHRFGTFAFWNVALWLHLYLFSHVVSPQRMA